VLSSCCSTSAASDAPVAAPEPAPEQEMPPKWAFATLTTNDAYVVGVVALYRSLSLLGVVSERIPLLVMVNDGVSGRNRQLLRDLGAEVIEVESLSNPASVDGNGQDVPRGSAKRRFDTVYSKLGMWRTVSHNRLPHIALERRRLDRRTAF
jgi:hypothetical protein